MPRRITKPVKGHHIHRCTNKLPSTQKPCGFTWAHSDKMKGNKPAHVCPRCGTSQYIRLRLGRRAIPKIHFSGCGAPKLKKVKQ